jgi:hypothetical protein
MQHPGLAVRKRLEAARVGGARVREHVTGDRPKQERRHPGPIGSRDVKERREHGRRRPVHLAQPWLRDDIAGLSACVAADGSRRRFVFRGCCPGGIADRAPCFQPGERPDHCLLLAAWMSPDGPRQTTLTGPGMKPTMPRQRSGSHQRQPPGQPPSQLLPQAACYPEPGRPPELAPNCSVARAGGCPVRSVAGHVVTREAPAPVAMAVEDVPEVSEDLEGNRPAKAPPRCPGCRVHAPRASLRQATSSRAGLPGRVT